MAQTEVRGTLPQSGPRRPAAAGPLARTLGITNTAVDYASRTCGLRRELNSHKRATPRFQGGSVNERLIGQIAVALVTRRNLTMKLRGESNQPYASSNAQRNPHVCGNHGSQFVGRATNGRAVCPSSTCTGCAVNHHCSVSTLNSPGPQIGNIAVRGSRTDLHQCCLTPRSSGAPTAGHQARPQGTVYIFLWPGLASSRCHPLSSNVRHHKTTSSPYPR